MKKYIFIFLILIFILNITPVLAFETECKKGDICYESEIAIPGFPSKVKVTGSLLGEYISTLYQYLLYVAGVLAVIVIMVGGFQWITAGGNQSKIGEAKERVTSAIIGLFLALGSYLLLFTINPDLVKIDDLSMEDINAITINSNKCDYATGWFQIMDEMRACSCEEGYTKEETNVDGVHCCRCLDESGNIPCSDNYEIVNSYQDCRTSRFYLIPSGQYCCYVVPEIEPDADCEGKEEWSVCSRDGQPGYCDSNLECSLCKRSYEYCTNEKQCLADYSGVEKCGSTQVGLSCERVGSQVQKRCQGSKAIE
jgi:hypothetical protein